MLNIFDDQELRRAGAVFASKARASAQNGDVADTAAIRRRNLYQ
jgi:hypothetical protein